MLLTGAFLAPVFKDLPQATLAAIVITAVTSFLRAGELRRFARVRRSAIVLALLAMAGVLMLGVLPGLIVTAAISLIVVIRRFSRPAVVTVTQDPLVLRVEGRRRGRPAADPGPPTGSRNARTGPASQPTSTRTQAPSATPNLKRV